MSMRSRILAGALTAALVAMQACAPTPAPSAAVRSALAVAAVPFTTAEVTSPDGRSFTVSWAAPEASAVTVYAGTDPDRIGRDRPVGKGAAQGNIQVDGLPQAARWYFELVPDRGVPLVVADRSLHLKSAPNFRDFGGYRTTDGRWVRMGALYRSDQLDHLSDADLDTLAKLNVRLVADLRTESERQREPDRLPDGARPLVADVMSDSANGVGGDMRKAMAQIKAGRGAEFLTTANRDFVRSESARRAYNLLFTTLADDTTSAVYHCTAGKDRTGWASAVLLTLLGVPRETVMADYLLSNAHLAAKNEVSLARMAAAPAEMRIDPDALKQVLTVQASFLQAAFDEVEARYGSFDAYLRDGLGLTETDLAQLRERYLVGN